MVYLIFVDGGLRSISTDKTDSSIQAQQLLKQQEGQHVRVIAVNGHVHEELHADDKEEA